jgi:hypothetical protein
MTDAAPASACCPTASCCPCKGEICRLSRTVRWMRIVLLVIAALLILLVGIGIGKGQARRAVGRGMAVAAMRNAGPGREGPAPMIREGRPLPGPDGDRGRRGDGPGRN